MSLSPQRTQKEQAITTGTGKPVVGILADIQTFSGRTRHVITEHYTQRIVTAGGVPMVIPPSADTLLDQLSLCDAIVLTGGDDPCTEPFGKPTHASAVRVDQLRQRVETQLIEHLAAQSPDMPVLGVCLGMQMMALVAGGHLNQHLPETHKTHVDHWDNDHEVIPVERSSLSTGTVHSMHRQAIEDPGSLSVLAAAHDGVVEAVGDPSRKFYLGVQWHPERTQCTQLGQDLFDELVRVSLK